MAKTKELKAQNPTYKIDVIDVLTKMDPTNTNKYLPFMIKCTADWVEWINNELKNETFREMFEVINDFEDLSQRNLLDNKDIYSYESNQDIIEAVKLAKEKVVIPSESVIDLYCLKANSVFKQKRKLHVLRLRKKKLKLFTKMIIG